MMEEDFASRTAWYDCRDYIGKVSNKSANVCLCYECKYSFNVWDVNVDETFGSSDFYFRNGIDRQFHVNIIPYFFNRDCW